MDNLFVAISPKELSDNTFVLLDNDWMLITAGDMNSFNMMTASWGGFGILWRKPVAYIFVRPQRHTLQFIEKSDFFTLTFYENKYRDVLNLCGSRSGKDFNKMTGSGLTPTETANGSIFFSEARLVVECRKLYSDDIKESNFIDQGPLVNYPQKDYHRMYIGAILSCMERKIQG